MSNDPVLIFSSAREKGWTRWTPPVIRGSRKNFLHEAVSRLYEEKICEAFSPEQSRRADMRSIRRSRVSSFHSEPHRHRPRKSSATSSVRTSASERPATRSGWEGLNHNLPVEQNVYDAQSSAPIPVTRKANTIVRKPIRAAVPPPARSAPPTPPQPQSYFAPSTITPLPPSLPPSPPSTFPSLSPQPDGSWLSSTSPVDNISNNELPTYPGRPTSWFQHPLQIQMNMTAEENRTLNTAEKATFRIVEMGFTHEEARGALKITDMGDGLRVDRAVEFLLRTRM